MNPIYKLFFAVGLIATGGEVATHGDEHAESLKKLAAPLLERPDTRPNRGIDPIPVGERELPEGVEKWRD